LSFDVLFSSNQKGVDQVVNKDDADTNTPAAITDTPPLETVSTSTSTSTIDDPDASKSVSDNDSFLGQVTISPSSVDSQIESFGQEPLTPSSETVVGSPMELPKEQSDDVAQLIPEVSNENSPLASTTDSNQSNDINEVTTVKFDEQPDVSTVTANENGENKADEPELKSSDPATSVPTEEAIDSNSVFGEADDPELKPSDPVTSVPTEEAFDSNVVVGEPVETNSQTTQVLDDEALEAAKEKIREARKARKANQKAEKQVKREQKQIRMQKYQRTQDQASGETDACATLLLFLFCQI
jgi:hypothetical protein